MRKKKTGWLGSLRAKIWATIVSLFTTVGGSAVAYYWNDITGKNPAEFVGASDKKGSVLIGTLTSLQKHGKLHSCDILGSEVSESNDHISVVSVKPGSTGALLGLIPGDVIESVDSQAIHSPELLEVSLARSRKFFSTTVKVRRGDAALRGEVHLNNDMVLAVRRPLAP